jgi:Zn-dependent M16 (insulinase) family peptidase
MIDAARFNLVTSQPVPALGVTLETWRHNCGAVHHHLACDDEHRAFVVAFRTTPEDSTGLPHILEHTTLCGSKRYPVRDPFFQMLRRSLQTFMNAMTFPDMTCYPFASQVAKDFDNLTGVYLDAVFAPLLHPLDFAQEGHRLEPATQGGERKGVVFNEMKGAMDGTSEQLSMATARTLLPATCYRHNYGGDPSDIPDLTHQDLLDFHRRCYRPANACFITYGNQPATELHARIADYLAGDPGLSLTPPTVQATDGKPTTLEVPVPFGPGQDILDVTAAALTWVWGDVADLDEVLTAELLDRLLFGHAGAPLRLALENSGLGRSISGSGFSAGYRNGLFTAELSGIDPADYPKVEPLVLETLRAIADRGIPPAELDAALHQLELARREISGDHYPYGLELCFRLLAPWNYGVEPLPFLDQSAAIIRLRERANQPGFLQNEIRRRLLDHQHRALLLAKPDREFHSRAQALEKQQVERDLGHLDDAGRQQLAQQAQDLAKRQASVDDPAVLPDLQLGDVPGERRFPVGTDHSGVTVFTAGTNGLLHHLAAIPLPELDDQELDLLPLLAQTIGSLGVGTQDYAARSALLNARCGGLWAWTDLSADIDDLARLHGLLFVEVKGLGSRHREFTDLITETLRDQRFNEYDRLRELVEQSVQRLSDRVSSAGNAFAARAACRGMGGAAALGHRLSGLGRLAWLKRLASSIGEDTPGADAALEKLGSALAALRSRLLSQPRHLAVIGDTAGLAEVQTQVRAAWSALGEPTGTRQAFRSLLARTEAATAYTTATAVNYCALAFPAVPLGHADAPALAVAGRLLVNNVLHPRIRERGGAYGSGASFAPATGTFTLTSYRDPRLSGTYDDFRESLRWLSDCPNDQRLLKEAILGVVAGLDSPGSPSGEARSRFTSDLKGSSPKRLNAFRARVLATTVTDIRRVANAWLPVEGGVPAVVTGVEQFTASGLGWATEAV